jgi:hypothetical protein
MTDWEAVSSEKLWSLALFTWKDGLPSCMGETDGKKIQCFNRSWQLRFRNCVVHQGREKCGKTTPIERGGDEIKHLKIIQTSKCKGQSVDTFTKQSTVKRYVCIKNLFLGAWNIRIGMEKFVKGT